MAGTAAPWSSTPTTFLDDEHLRIADTDFHCSLAGDIPPGRLHLMKARDLVEKYLALAGSLGGPARRIVELGIFRGGSTPFVAEVFRPERLVAIELSEDPAPGLADFIETRGLGEVIRPHYGVDQADKAGVTAVVEAELGGEPLDLVLDDASHRYLPTVASFEVLFPRLRPGAPFVIEDWNGAHHFAEHLTAMLRDPAQSGAVERRIAQSMEQGAGRPAGQLPLSHLVLQFVLSRASSREAIESITVDRHWACVWRGPAELDPGSFRVADLFDDHFNQLTPV